LDDPTSHVLARHVHIAKHFVKGLHMFVGMMEFCLKDWQEPHFNVIDVNINAISAKEKNACIDKYTKYGAISTKNCVPLSSMNVIDHIFVSSKYHLQTY
jgi:hypothetical protein